MVALPTSRGGVDKLKKDEVKELLSELGCPAPPTWNADECRTELKEKLFPKNPDSVEAKMKGVSSMTKTQLLHLAEEIGAHHTKNYLKADLIKAIRAKYRERTAPTGTDVMEFGAHREKTYNQVKETEEQYCDWAKKTVEENGREAHPDLRRFVSWLNGEAVTMETGERDEPGERPSGQRPPPVNRSSRATRGSSAASSARSSNAPESSSLKEKIAQLEARNQELEKEKDLAQTGSQRRCKEAPSRETPQEMFIGTPSEQSSQTAATNVLEGIAATLQQLHSRMDRMEQVNQAEASSTGSWAKPTQSEGEIP